MPMLRKIHLTLCLFPLLANCAHVADAVDPQVTIDRAIIRDSAGETSGEVAAYARFRNAGPATAIVAAECACSQGLELHVMKGEGSERRMTNIWPLELPSGETVAIVPGSPSHMMLVGITGAIAVGEKRRLRFRLYDGRWAEADFVAVPNSAEAWAQMDSGKND